MGGEEVKVVEYDHKPNITNVCSSPISTTGIKVSH
jgi:hypothetical protein